MAPAGDGLRAEAIRLARILTSLMPDEPEVTGLLALLLLTESRFRSRVTADGALVLLRDQDRTRWDRALIEEGHALVRDCLRRDRPGPYQLQAAINAVHTDAETFWSTDWPQILTLYDQLLTYTPTPVVALNRAIAAGEVHAREPRWTSSTSSTCPRTTSSTPPAPTCCAASAGPSTPPPPTTPRPV